MSNSPAPKSSHYFSRQPFSIPQQLSTPLRIQVAQSTLEMVTGRGVFAKAGLDAGSKLLLEALWPLLKTFPSQTRIGDLGCGWGALGCFLAHQSPQSSVLLCDINAHATWLARHNARQNQLLNAHVWCGDGLNAAREACFDLIVSNPPIRVGNPALKVLFTDALRCLKPGGQFWIVIRTAQGAKSWQKRLQNQFGNCETVALKSGYRILRCDKKKEAETF